MRALIHVLFSHGYCPGCLEGVRSLVESPKAQNYQTLIGVLLQNWAAATGGRMTSNVFQRKTFFLFRLTPSHCGVNLMSSNADNILNFRPFELSRHGRWSGVAGAGGSYFFPAAPLYMGVCCSLIIVLTIRFQTAALSWGSP